MINDAARRSRSRTRRTGQHAAAGVVVIAWIVFAGAACTTGATTATPSPTAMSFETYSVSFCAAFDALFRAVGNPDTGSGSELTRLLDDAIQARDAASVDRLAANITAELEVARGHAAAAGGWLPRAQMMAQLDRMLVASESMIAAKRAAAHQSPDEAASLGQAAFEQAGGVEAWFAMIKAATPIEETGQQCANVPISP